MSTNIGGILAFRFLIFPLCTQASIGEYYIFTIHFFPFIVYPKRERKYILKKRNWKGLDSSLAKLQRH